MKTLNVPSPDKVAGHQEDPSDGRLTKTLKSKLANPVSSAEFDLLATTNELADLAADRLRANCDSAEVRHPFDICALL